MSTTISTTAAGSTPYADRWRDLPAPIRNVCEKIYENQYEVGWYAFQAAAGAAYGGLVTGNPIGVLVGAVWGVSVKAFPQGVNWVCEKLNCCPDSVPFKIAQLGLATTASIGIWYAGFFGGGVAAVSAAIASTSLMATVSTVALPVIFGVGIGLALAGAGALAYKHFAPATTA